MTSQETFKMMNIEKIKHQWNYSSTKRSLSAALDKNKKARKEARLSVKNVDPNFRIRSFNQNKTSKILLTNFWTESI